jgi:hypothetical protein
MTTILKSMVKTALATMTEVPAMSSRCAGACQGLGPQVRILTEGSVIKVVGTVEHHVRVHQQVDTSFSYLQYIYVMISIKFLPGIS